MRTLFPSPPSPPPLLRLPLELRREIYRHLLPHTTTKPSPAPHFLDEQPAFFYNGRGLPNPTQAISRWYKQRCEEESLLGSNLIWHRGCTKLLLANRQMHDECADMMYGDNVFVVHVAFDGITFRYQYPVPSSNLMGKGAKDFLNHFSQRNLLRIRNIYVNVVHVDDYTGMIKYNCGGRGLTAGYRDQVQNLVEQLAAAECIHRLHVHVIQSEGRISSEMLNKERVEGDDSRARTVLEPFHRLRNIRMAKVTGVGAEEAEALERCMMRSLKRSA